MCLSQDWLLCCCALPVYAYQLASYLGSSQILSCRRPGYAMEKKSSIIAIGLSVHQTPVDIREQLSIAEVRSCLLRRAEL